MRWDYAHFDELCCCAIFKSYFLQAITGRKSYETLVDDVGQLLVELEGGDMDNMDMVRWILIVKL